MADEPEPRVSELFILMEKLDALFVAISGVKDEQAKEIGASQRWAEKTEALGMQISSLEQKFQQHEIDDTEVFARFLRMIKVYAIVVVLAIIAIHTVEVLW